MRGLGVALALVLLFAAGVSADDARVVSGSCPDCSSGLPLRTFTPAERARFETQYGPNWWQAMGLIPGPSTAGDYVEQPFGDSSRTIYSPRQFWDPRR